VFHAPHLWGCKAPGQQEQQQQPQQRQLSMAVPGTHQPEALQQPSYNYRTSQHQMQQAVAAGCGGGLSAGPQQAWTADQRLAPASPNVQAARQAAKPRCGVCQLNGSASTQAWQH
jgi:hypothetical protein